MKKCYLGDSVYVTDEGDHLVLTTENGYGPTNSIYLEPEVIESLIRYLERSRNLKITVEKAPAESASEASGEGA